VERKRGGGGVAWPVATPFSKNSTTARTFLGKEREGEKKRGG